jgi:hypothetical protein
LFLTGQFGQTVGEGVGDSEVHNFSIPTLTRLTFFMNHIRPSQQRVRLHLLE